MIIRYPKYNNVKGKLPVDFYSLDNQLNEGEEKIIYVKLDENKDPDYFAYYDNKNWSPKLMNYVQ